MSREYIQRLVKDTTKSTVRVIGKERIYVDDYSEVPDGAALQEGERHGLYYETEQVEEFQADQEERTNKILEEHDFPEEDIQRARKKHEEYAADAEDNFNYLMQTAEQTGVELVGGRYRVKGVGSMLKKASDYRPEADYDDIDELHDVLGCMVQPEDPEGVNKVGDALKEEIGEENIVKDENYMEEPQGGYYRARQFVFELPNGHEAEVQVKSPELADIAHVGHALVFKNDESPEAPDLEEEMQEKVRDCLSQLSDITVGERTGEPECDRQASQHINEMAEEIGVG